MTSGELHLVVEVANLLMSLKRADLRYYLTHHKEIIFYAAALHGTQILKTSLLEWWIEVDRLAWP